MVEERSAGERQCRLVPPEFIAELCERYPFPDPRSGHSEGLLAYGGDLEAGRLLAAYAQGLFPWYESPPILWYSPDPRAVLFPEALRINRSLAKNLRRAPYTLTLDQNFAGVIEACAQAPRPGQSGTWINDDMIRAYCELHELGFAHSVEAHADGELVGGIYGVSLGAAFFGESMFSRRSDASKIALVALVDRIRAWGFRVLDCQAHTENTERLGAVLQPRAAFLDLVSQALEAPTRCGQWELVGSERRGKEGGDSGG
ncbi:MAG: leucyl/phenylalanyl-tRNA--protein transferase [Myxococcota bacterium]|jgi:leucyl/phenylalanyl-tRNA---protein transferase|nr:leucyl/phenylalanyl-tRNA--protein transferase [Myxococcota bacterium]